MPSLKTPFLTTWFDRGPAPGQRGTAAIYGHVDAQKVGPAVFYRLGSLRPEDLIYITLASSDVAIFRVYAIAMYAKARFPDRDRLPLHPLADAAADHLRRNLRSGDPSLPEQRGDLRQLCRREEIMRS